MCENTRLQKIRASERKSHTEMYSGDELYKEDSWLKKPVKTVLDILPLFDEYKELRVLDLGCGVGRNCIAIAQRFKDIFCQIDCVDFLELAIEKLLRNSYEYNVASAIKGTIQTIEEYVIKDNYYDLILAVSALEHVDSKETFCKKLAEIGEGIREGGVVCLVINSNVLEKDKSTGVVLPPQFEVNLLTEELQSLLDTAFAGWIVLKSTVREQQYDIPREGGISELSTAVVTFVARK